MTWKIKGNRHIDVIGISSKDFVPEEEILLPTPGNFSLFNFSVLYAILRVVTACFMLVRSAMFGGTFNLVSHVGLP